MTGTILKLLDNGYGFLQGDDAPGERLFFHARSLRTGLIFERDLHVGMRVTFERAIDPRSQREQAFDVRLLDVTSAPPR
jgi:hypothetical protein